MNYLYENGDRVVYGNIDVNDQRSHWELLNVGDGSVRIRNRASGEYMNIEHLYGYVECTAIETSWYSARWYVEDAGNGEKRIRNSWQSSNYIHIQNLQGYAQRGTIYDTWANAKWVLETVGGVSPTPTPTLTPTPTPTPGPTPTVGPTPTPVPVPTPIPGSIGATMPYTRYESEDAAKGGTAALRQALDFNVLNPASEASNQKYVALPSNGAGNILMAINHRMHLAGHPDFALMRYILS